MEKNSTTAEAAPLFAGEAWFDPIEAELRERVRRFLAPCSLATRASASGRAVVLDQQTAVVCPPDISRSTQDRPFERSIMMVG